MNNDNKEVKVVKCLMLNESKDILTYGSDDSSSKLQTLTFILNENGLKKCLEFQYEPEFILHIYVVDNLDAEMVVGVNRFDKCQVKNVDIVKKNVKIKACNKEFFNMSQLKLLRKDKIGNILSEMGDESPTIEN